MDSCKSGVTVNCDGQLQEWCNCQLLRDSCKSGVTVDCWSGVTVDISAYMKDVTIHCD